MDFGQLLDNYITDTRCTAKELANVTGISASVISRYRTGERIPALESDIVKRLADGISKLSGTSSDIIYNQMVDSLSVKNSLAKQAFYKVDNLVGVLGIKQSDLAKVFNYDASFISRVLSGQRFPADIDGFLTSISEYFADVAFRNEKISQLREIINSIPDDIDNKPQLAHHIYVWLNQDDTPTISFLGKLGSFDMNTFLETIQVDEIDYPTTYQPPVSKYYRGVEEMHLGELDFMFSTVMSRSMEDVYIYSDMPINEMNAFEKQKRFMMGLALMVKKGLHIHVIHNLNRPEEEMFIGLESWTPIYMTGQIIPYYLPDYQDEVFSHLICTSGSVALFGTAISGNKDHGLYFLTRNKDELNFFQTRSADLMKKAKPLMEVFQEKDRERFYDRIRHLLEQTGDLKIILSAPPLAALTDELIEKMVDNYIKSENYNGRPRKQLIEELKNTAEFGRKQFQIKFLEYNITGLIYIIPKEEFNRSPVYLSLGIGFTKFSIPYTYDTYLEHVNLTRKYAKTHSAFKLKEQSRCFFRNIQIFISKDKDNKKSSWVLVSKSLSPSIHFIIHHPKLVEAISHLEV